MMMLGEAGYGHNMHKARALTHVGTLNSGPVALPAQQRYAHGLQEKNQSSSMTSYTLASWKIKDAVVWSRR